MRNEYIQLASGVVKEGLPFRTGGRIGFKKGCIAVQIEGGRLKLICENLLPIELEAMSLKSEKAAHEYQSILVAFDELRDAWFGTPMHN